MVVLKVLWAFVLLAWSMLWPIAFGFILSSFVRSMVPSGVVVRHIGKNTWWSGIISALFGVVSSVCNYATAGVGRTLRLKGASWSNTLVYMLCSANIGITMVVAIYGFLGGKLLALEVATALVLAAVSFYFAIVFRLPASKAEEPVEDESMPMKMGYWAQSCTFFYDDITMTQRDIGIGLFVAATLGVIVPATWWQDVFLLNSGSNVMVWAWNAFVGTLIAVLTFGCSIGNVALGAVLWWNGVTPGGVMAFMLASLLTFPMLIMYKKYYGFKVTFKLVAVLVLALIVSSVIIDFCVWLFSIEFVRYGNIFQHVSKQKVLVTLGLNLIFGGLGAWMWIVGRNHSKMHGGMKGDMKGMHHDR